MKNFLFCFAFILFACPHDRDMPAENISFRNIPSDTRQIVLVIAENWNVRNAEMYRFERTRSNLWKQSGSRMSAILGRNGLAWGRGIKIFSSNNSLLKKEGDGRAPAGIFSFGEFFGFEEYDSAKKISRMPYLHIRQMTECIDDTASQQYNKIVDDVYSKGGWNSSEKMFYLKKFYKWGIVVRHNTEPVEKGAGSCIFMHIWGSKDTPTSGCTAMSEENLLELLGWLQPDKNPVLIQIPLSEKQNFLSE